MTIGFITKEDPLDKRSWSGTLYKMFNSLEKQDYNVVAIGPVKLNIFVSFFLNIILLLNTIISYIFYKKKYNKSHNRLVSLVHSKFFEKKIKKASIDIIFAPAASTQIAYLNIEIPIFYYSDATLSLLIDYYEPFSRLSKYSIEESINIEQRAINNSIAQIYPSKWALKSALIDYKAKNTYLVSLGANIDNIPAKNFNKNFDSTFELLFVGVDWERKGGDIVFDTFEKLLNKGYDISLTIVGTTPPKTHPKIKVIPFLNKNNKEELLILEELLKCSHLFFLPTRAECYGIVFCEANAYGIPVISTDTGGVSSVIQNGVNGFLLPIDAKSDEYSSIIEKLILDKNKLKKLSETSRIKYESDLNWDVWGSKMKIIFEENINK